MRHTKGEETYWVVFVSQHKTSATDGPARLVIADHLKQFFDKYAEAQQGRGTNDLLFVGAMTTNHQRFKVSCEGVWGGTPFLDHPQKSSWNGGIFFAPKEQENVAVLFNNSVDTQRRYYRKLEATKDTLEAFECVTTLFCLWSFPSNRRS